MSAGLMPALEAGFSAPSQRLSTTGDRVQAAT